MPAFYTSEAEISLLVHSFAARTLAKEKWTHAAHITAALWHLKNYPFDDAVCGMRSKIISYNISVGTPNNASSGYHETMTIFWMYAGLFFINTCTGETVLNICNAFLSSPLAERSLPFYFYKRETILSSKARAVFVAADIKDYTDELFEKIYNRKVILG